MSKEELDGSSIERAIVLDGVNDNFKGIEGEYRYISEKYGQDGIDWHFKSQKLLNIEGKLYDKIEFTLFSGEKKELYFDTTGFFGNIFE